MASSITQISGFVITIRVLVGFLPVEGLIYMTVNSNAVEQGKMSSFDCLHKGTDQPVTIVQWLKNGQIVQQDTRISKSPSLLENKLVIRNTQTSDTGEYMCVTGSGQNATQYLVVYCQVVAYPQPATVRAVVGGNATLQCDGECYDYIVWAKNNFIVASTEPERFYSPGNGSTLHITNISMSDNGTYMCGFISLKTVYTTVQLMVIEPADHVIVSRSNNVIEVGHDYELLCQSNGNPPPESVTWFNNSKPIRNTKRVASKYDKETGKATLSISPVTRYDVSTLQCRFEQELSGGQFNYIKSVIHITPTDKPDPPTDLKTDVLVFSDSSIQLKVRLSWTPPTYTGNLNMLAYRVTYWDEYQCQRSQCSEDEYWLDGSVASHQFELKIYINATRLCFSVQSVNNDGLSVASDVKCVGVKHFSPDPISPTPNGSEPTTQAVLRQAVRRPFQVALKNVEKLCSGLFKVSEDTLTGALVSLFNWHCSCNVVTDDVTADTYTQLGGVLYYRGSIASPQADSILRNLSHYIQAGGERLGLSGSYLYFITSCPTRVNDGVCKLSTEDSFALGCSEEDERTNSPHTDKLKATHTEKINATVNNEGYFSPLSIIIIAVLAGFLIISTGLCVYCYRRSRATSSKDTQGRGSSKAKFFPRCRTTSTDANEGQESIKESTASIRSNSDTTDVEKTTILVIQSGDRDSGVSGVFAGSEIDHWKASLSSGTEFSLLDKQERGETKV